MSGNFYRAFEDRYRGSRTLIKERLRVYQPFLDTLAAGAAALDLGCGRGEWLELLGEAGFAARGVDLDEGMLAACRERGLDVVNGDAIDALRTAADNSLAVVSAFHLVEHIAFDQVQQLVAEALRALRPGGLLILETPNPENLVVGTSSFYDDPSHLRPLPPKLLAFAVEFAGFGRHAVLRLQEDPRLHETAPPQLFDVLAGASPDYGVIGQKAGIAEAASAFDTLAASTRGIDLHALAGRYQQHQHDVEARLAQASDAVSGLIERQDYYAHMADVRLNELNDRIGQLDMGAVAARLAEVETTLASLQATSASLANDIAQGAAAQDTFATHLAQLETAQPELSGRVERVEASLLQQSEQTALRLPELSGRVERLEASLSRQSEQTASRLRARIVELEQTQELSEQESNRLAQHVAWIEGRLSHAEAEAAALRFQLTSVQQRQAPLHARLARLVAHARRQAAATRQGRRLRERGAGLLRQLIQLVLRDPALKRTARLLVARFPRLRARLLRLLYTPAPGATLSEAPADPLTTQMSPRSLAIYRALTNAKKSEN